MAEDIATKEAKEQEEAGILADLDRDIEQYGLAKKFIEYGAEWWSRGWQSMSIGSLLLEIAKLERDVKYVIQQSMVDNVQFAQKFYGERLAELGAE